MQAFQWNLLRDGIYIIESIMQGFMELLFLLDLD